MSRVHTLTAILAVGLHALLAVPWWLRHSLATAAPKIADSIEIPLEVPIDFTQ